MTNPQTEDVRILREAWEAAIAAERAWRACPNDQIPNVTKAQQRRFGALAWLYTIGDTRYGDGPAERALNPALNFGINDVGDSRRFDELQRQVSEVVDKLSDVPFNSRADRLIWPSFFDLVAAIRNHDTMETYRLADELAGLKTETLEDLNRDAAVDGNNGAYTFSSAWWRLRARAYDDFSFLPPRTCA